MSDQKIEETNVEIQEPEFKVEDDAENNITLPEEGDLQDKDEEDEEKEDLIEEAENTGIAEEKDVEKGEDVPIGDEVEHEPKPEDGAEKEEIEKTEEILDGPPPPEEAAIEDQKHIETKIEEPTAEDINAPSLSSIEEEEVSEQVAEAIDREAYIARYKELMEERTELNLRNLIFNRKCVEYFKRKKIALTPREDIQDVDEVEKNYNRLLLQFEECEKHLENEQAMVDAEMEKLHSSYGSRDKKYFEDFNEFLQLERQVAKKLLFSTDGKKLQNPIIDRYLSRQTKKIEELIDMRLKFIMTRNTLTKMENKLLDVDQLDEGFHVKDFQQLQATNDAYMKKLEEKDGILLQQRAVCATYIEMLAHMKEQMNFEVRKCEDARGELGYVENQYFQARADQSNAKYRLRKLKAKLHHQNEQMGLANYPKLYADFKETHRKIAKLETDLAVLLDELEKAKLEKAYQSVPSIFDKHCVQLKSGKTRPKFHQSAFLPL